MFYSNDESDTIVDLIDKKLSVMAVNDFRRKFRIGVSVPEDLKKQVYYVKRKWDVRSNSFIDMDWDDFKYEHKSSMSDPGR